MFALRIAAVMMIGRGTGRDQSRARGRENDAHSGALIVASTHLMRTSRDFCSRLVKQGFACT